MNYVFVNPGIVACLLIVVIVSGLQRGLNP